MVVKYAVARHPSNWGKKQVSTWKTISKNSENKTTFLGVCKIRSSLVKPFAVSITCAQTLEYP